MVGARECQCCPRSRSGVFWIEVDGSCESHGWSVRSRWWIGTFLGAILLLRGVLVEHGLCPHHGRMSLGENLEPWWVEQHHHFGIVVLPRGIASEASLFSCFSFRAHMWLASAHGSQLVGILVVSIAAPSALHFFETKISRLQVSSMFVVVVLLSLWVPFCSFMCLHCKLVTSCSSCVFGLCRNPGRLIALLIQSRAIWAYLKKSLTLNCL
jgi:hypothetical protein